MTAERAYAEVERLTRQRARNFAYGIMVLPREKRRAIAAIYAFARRVDDIADGELEPAEKRARLDELRARPSTPSPATTRCSSRSPTRARASRFPAHALHALVDGGLQDLEQSRYADFDELRGYCTKVAGAVGVCCVAVYGSDDVERAETLGIALQLINIIRDVREDWELGRVYLPQDELSSFGVTEDDIAARERVTCLARADDLSGRARARVPAGRARPAALARLPQRALRVDVRGSLPRDARPDRGARATTSSTGRRTCRRSRSSASSGRVSGEGGGRRRRPRRARAPRSTSSTPATR